MYKFKFRYGTKFIKQKARLWVIRYLERKKIWLHRHDEIWKKLSYEWFYSSFAYFLLKSNMVHLISSLKMPEYHWIVYFVFKNIYWKQNPISNWPINGSLHVKNADVKFKCENHLKIKQEFLLGSTTISYFGLSRERPFFCFILVFSEFIH